MGNLIFNISGDCKPGFHYMVDIASRLSAIKAMVNQGQYVTINRARQYGKTTTRRAYYIDKGEKQLMDYLDHKQIKKGYMVSFNFNKKKEIGVKRIILGDKILVEAVV